MNFAQAENATKMIKVKKLFLCFSATMFLAGGIILIFAEPALFPDFYEPKFFGIFSIIWAFLIILPGLIFNAAGAGEEKRKSLLDFRLAIAVSFFLGAAGSLGLYRLHEFGFEYDKLIHFIIGLIAVLAGARFIRLWFGVSFKKSLFWAAGLVVLGGFAWELGEFALDAALGTKTLGIYGKFIVRDTILDLAMDILGAATALLILILRRTDLREFTKVGPSC